MKTIASIALSVSVLAWWGLDPGPDILSGEVPSPDGVWVARMWCANSCVSPHVSTVTLSPASRQLELVRDGDWAPEGRLPKDDVVVRVHRVDDYTTLTLSWSEPALLMVSGLCLSGQNDRRLTPLKHRGVSVRFSDIADPADCERLRG